MSNVKYAQKDGQRRNLAMKESQGVQSLKEKENKQIEQIKIHSGL